MSEITKSEFIKRFLAHCLDMCGFERFDDGMPVKDYAVKVAESYWADEAYRADGPEACAEADMSYWGEE